VDPDRIGLVDAVRWLIGIEGGDLSELVGERSISFGSRGGRKCLLLKMVPSPGLVVRT
jgi:hypothetical protein